MRRMYSKQELEKTILEYTNKEIESGNIDLDKAPTKSFDMSFINLGGRTIVNSYSKAVVYHGLLFIVFNFYINNETEATISGSSIGVDFILDEDTAKKVYDFDGISVDEANPGSQYQMICSVPFGRGQYGNDTQTANLVRAGSSYPRQLRLNVSIGNLSAGASHKVSGRTFILLV